MLIWGSGYIASKTGLQYASPFSFLCLRFGLGIVCAAAWLRLSSSPASPVRWPATRREALHLAVAGLLMHAANLGGSHYAQFLGLSAGVTALILATQPLLTALFAHRFLGQRLGVAQWLGVALGLGGVALVVWHKIDVRAATPGSLLAVAISLVAITAGTLYQRVYCASADLRSAAVLQFAVCLVCLLPLAFAVEGFAVQWRWSLGAALLYLVLFGSIFAVNTLHALMRRGHAAKVTSLLFLTPAVAVALEWAFFGVRPTPLALVGVAVASAGVALVARR